MMECFIKNPVANILRSGEKKNSQGVTHTLNKE